MTVTQPSKWSGDGTAPCGLVTLVWVWGARTLPLSSFLTLCHRAGYLSFENLTNWAILVTLWIKLMQSPNVFLSPNRVPGTMLGAERDEEEDCLSLEVNPRLLETLEPLTVTLIYRKTRTQLCPAVTWDLCKFSCLQNPDKPSLSPSTQSRHMLLEGVGDIWTIYFLVGLLFPPIRIFSSPTWNKTSANIKIIRNVKASILINSIDLFIGCFLFLFLFFNG